MDNKQQLKKRIQQTELQIKKLDQHTSGSEVCEDLYNSLILQKAVMKKQLEEQKKSGSEQLQSQRNMLEQQMQKQMMP